MKTIRACVSYLLIKLDCLMKISISGMEHSRVIILKIVPVYPSFSWKVVSTLFQSLNALSKI